MQSLRQTLAKTGNNIPFSIQSGFQTYPNSIREIIRMLNLPKPELETLEHRMVYDFTEENAQGLVFAHDSIWFLSSEKRIFKYSIKGPDYYRPSEVRCLKSTSLAELVEATKLDKNHFDHIGDIDYLDGLIYLPVRRSSQQPPHLLLVLSENLEVVGYSLLPSDTGESWCAINPWNRLLYIANLNRSDHLSAYDISEYYRLFPNRGQWGKHVDIQPREDQRFWFYNEDGSLDTVPSIQGVMFSPNGRLYIARYHSWSMWPFGTRWDNYLRIYNALTGVRTGEREFNFEGVGDEIEGISIHPSGVIYVAVADNDANNDEFEIHAFKYPTPSFPV